MQQTSVLKTIEHEIRKSSLAGNVEIRLRNQAMPHCARTQRPCTVTAAVDGLVIMTQHQLTKTFPKITTNGEEINQMPEQIV